MVKTTKRLFFNIKIQMIANKSWVLRLRSLGWDKRGILYRVTQENSIENSIQDGLPYIQMSNGLCELFLTYPKWPCLCLKVSHVFPTLYDIIFPEPSTSSPVSCDFMTISSDVICCVTVWSCHSNPNSSSKNRIMENKSKRK